MTTTTAGTRKHALAAGQIIHRGDGEDRESPALPIIGYAKMSTKASRLNKTCQDT